MIACYVFSSSKHPMWLYRRRRTLAFASGNYYYYCHCVYDVIRQKTDTLLGPIGPTCLQSLANRTVRKIVRCVALSSAGSTLCVISLYADMCLHLIWPFDHSLKGSCCFQVLRPAAVGGGRGRAAAADCGPLLWNF